MVLARPEFKGFIELRFFPSCYMLCMAYGFIRVWLLHVLLVYGRGLG